MKITNAVLGKLALLAAVLVVVTAIVYSSAGRKSGGAFVPGSPLVQGLDTAQIAKIVVREKDKNAYRTATLTLQNNDIFAVAEKSGYPADNAEINELLRTVLDIRTAARLADNPQANPEFGVAADKPATGDVAFFDKNGKELLKITVGAVNGRGHNVSAGREVYRSENLVQISGRPLSFIDQSALKLDSKKVQSVEIRRADGEVITFLGKDGIMKLQNIPAGKEENDSETWGVKEGLTRLTFDDVAPFRPAEKFTKLLTANIIMNDGGAYHLTLGKDGAQYKLTVFADEPRRDQLTADKLVIWENAVRFNRAHKNWIFNISSWEGERLDKKLEKFLKDAPKPEVKKDAPKTETKKTAEKENTQSAPAEK